MRRILFISGGMLLCLSVLLRASFPLWLDSPTGRINPNDPKSPLFRAPTATPAPTPVSAGSQTLTPSITFSPTISPTFSISPSITQTRTYSVTWPPTPTPACTLPSSPASVAFVLGQSSDYTGAVNFGGISAASLYGVEGIACEGGRFFAADRDNNRVLIWNSIPSSMGQPADLVLGQPNFSSSAPGLSPSTLFGPTDVCSDGTRLVVAEAYNHRVLIWNSLPVSNQVPADVVLGQPNFFSNTINNGGISASSFYNPWGVRIIGGKLVVADTANNRVLIWNSVPTVNGTAANLVLGQGSFTSSVSAAGTTGMNKPIALGSDGTRLLIADINNNRVLIYNTVPVSNTTPADLELGQTNFSGTLANSGGRSASSLNGPWGMMVSGGSLYVADQNNHRVLAWDTFPTVNHAAANRVIGQPSFTVGSAGTGPNSFNYPLVPVAYADNIYISEFGNNRISVYNCQFLPTPTTSATITPTFSISPTATPSPSASPTATASPTPPPLVLVGCASDNTAGWPSSGSLPIGTSNSFVPLCNGWVITGDQTLNQIKILNANGGWIGGTYPLTASPDRMAYDSVNGVLYVSLLASSIITRINLSTGVESQITLSSQPYDLVVGPPGEIFVSYGTYPLTLALLDGATGSLVCSASPFLSPGLLAYDQVHAELFVGDEVDDVYGFAYDAGAGTLTQNQYLGFTINTYARYPLAVSPDGKHLAGGVGGNSGLHYAGATDYDTTNITWRMGMWPAGGNAFSPDSLYVASANYPNFSVSSVDRHLMQSQMSSGFWGSYVEQVAFSRGGGIVYALANISGSTTIHWMLWSPNPQPTPTPNPVSLAYLSCTSDTLGTLPASGSFALSGPAQDFIPLCSGLVITEDQNANLVMIVDSTGTILSTYALPACPGEMALDSTNGWLYVACNSDHNLIKLNLLNGTMSNIPLTDAPWSVALGTGGRGFASLDNNVWFKQISVFDGSTGFENVTRAADTYWASDLAFDPVANNLYLTDTSVYMERMQFDTGTLSLTKVDSNFTLPQTAALSPDGLHFAAPAGSNSFVDYSSTVFSTTFGSWNTAFSPRACSFSLDGSHFLGGDYQNMYVFDSVTHAVLKTISLGTSSSDQVSRAKFSRGGKVAYGLVRFNGAPNSTVVWAQYP